MIVFILKITQHWCFFKTGMCIYLPPDIQENEDAAVSSAEPGSGSDSGSGEILTERDEHIRKILDLQRSIPYKERKNIVI